MAMELKIDKNDMLDLILSRIDLLCSMANKQGGEVLECYENGLWFRRALEYADAKVRKSLSHLLRGGRSRLPAERESRDGTLPDDEDGRYLIYEFPFPGILQEELLRPALEEALETLVVDEWCVRRNLPASYSAAAMEKLKSVALLSGFPYVRTYNIS